MGKGDVVAKRIRLGRRTELPLWALVGYVSAGPILYLGGALDLSSTLRGPVMFIAIIAFLTGAVVHILDKIGRLKEAVTEKIDDSVGGVYDAGERAGVRHEVLAAESQPLAVVRDLSPR
jgi:hypothetical protein